MSSPPKRILSVRNDNQSWFKTTLGLQFPENYHLLPEDIVRASSFDIELVKNDGNDNEKSASNKKFGSVNFDDYNRQSSSCLLSDSSDEDSDEGDDNEDRDDESEENIKSCSSWIMDMKLLSEALKKVAVCKVCHQSLNIYESENHRTGLGSRFEIKCQNKECKNNEHFFSSRKQGKIFDVNRKTVLGFRMIGKGQSAAKKLFSVIGLSNPISRQSWADHTKYLEKVSFDMKDECMKKAGENAIELTLKDKHAKSDNDNAQLEKQEPVDVETSFDGS